MRIRPATPIDFPAVLALNAESVHFLSPLSSERLVHLHNHAAVHQVVEQEGTVIAFLLAFREGAPYDSVNYQWFASRYACFLYIDRVVVSQRVRAKGAGTALYRHAFAHAAAGNVPVVTCEFDVDPPNPVSERFHARFGFREVGRQLVAGGMKAVSLQAASVNALDEEVHDAWDEEIKRRVAEVENGAVKPVPADEVFARLRRLRK